MSEIELRFEALQCFLAARRSGDREQAELLHAEGKSLSKRADEAALSENRLVSNDRVAIENAA